MKKNKPIKWTIDLLKVEARKYNRRCDFQKGSCGAYLSARRRGLLDEICSHMQPPATEKYTDEEIIEIASKYSKRSDFQKSSKAYSSALLKGKDFLDRVCSHMKIIKRSKHTLDSAKEDAVKYKTRREFCLNDAGSYLAAVKNGWIDEICEHMKPVKKGRGSRQEIEILEICKKHYPNAHSRYFKNKDKNKYPQSSYELDIYIPEIQKGIEFDGDYWHSVKVLKKTRNITQEQAEQYHTLKDSFFKNELNIEVLHIKEGFWKRDRLWQIRTILSFIGILSAVPSIKRTDFYRRNSEESVEEFNKMEEVVNEQN